MPVKKKTMNDTNRKLTVKIKELESELAKKTKRYTTKRVANGS